MYNSTLGGSLPLVYNFGSAFWIVQLFVVLLINAFKGTRLQSAALRTCQGT